MRQVALVVNPEAGHGSGRLLTPRVEAALADAGVAALTTMAQSAEHAAAACAEAVSTSSRCSVPASIASNTSKSVITFVMDAQGRCTWADFSYNT